MVTPVANRQAVAHRRVAYEVSQRRACQVIGADRTSMRYRSVRLDDAALRTRLRELGAQRRRFGCRRLLVLIRREGIRVNHKRLRRLYRELPRRKRALGTRSPMTIAQGPNQRWSIDFLNDQLSDGRRSRMLAAVDDFTRECLALVADTGARVGRELDPSKTNGDCLRQRHRADQQGDSALVVADPREYYHRAGQADPERLYRELQGSETSFLTRRSSPRSITPAKPSPIGKTITTTSDRTSALNNTAPAIYATFSASGMQRAGALELPRGSAPAPLHIRAAGREPPRRPQAAQNLGPACC